MRNWSNFKSSIVEVFVDHFGTNLLHVHSSLWNYLRTKKSAAREDKQPSWNEVWKVWGQLRGGKKKKAEGTEQRKETFMAVCVQLSSSVSGQSVLLASTACTITSSLTGLPGRPAATAHPSPRLPPPLLPLPKQPHYNCVSSEWPTTSYLSSGMGSFMSAGHRFNTRSVGGMTGGPAGWWMACLSVEAVLPTDRTPLWRCWGHCRQMKQRVLLGNISDIRCYSYELVG